MLIFHCLLVKNALSLGICGGDAYSRYIDDHLEWVNGDSISQTLQSEAVAGSRRVSQFAGAVPTDVTIDVQPQEIELTNATMSSFHPAASFAGVRDGFEFKTGPKGTGYYATN